MTTERCLVVDLDGTLLRSDMLFETFWSALSHHWTTPFVALRSLLSGGKAALKQRLFSDAALDVRALPYNKAVIDYIAAWRAKGGQTALVTASNAELAQQVAGHLGLFDEVYGSDAETNLKGARKARFLTERYGAGGFDYIGDSTADLAVWRQSGRTILAGASPALRRKIDRPGAEIVDLPLPRPGIKPYLRLLRPHQWLKNLLIFLPLLAAHRLDSGLFAAALLAFCAFSLVASAGYMLNDMLDLASDRAHPRKRNRPLASGAVPLSQGTWIAPVLLVAGAALAVPLGPAFWATLAGYFVVTMSYSLYFKRKVILDICILAGLYTVRIVAGGMATGISLSFWLLAFSLALFFSLAAIKRQAELVDSCATGRARIDGRGYRNEDLPLVMSMATSSGYAAILILALYITSPDVLRLYHRPEVLWAGCAVMFYWINRMVMLTHRGQMHDDPVVFAATDRISLICLCLMLAIGMGASL